jgi:cytochrome b
MTERLSDDHGLPVRVWDLPTRLFHWALAACVIGAVITARIGGNAIEWHLRLGLAALALLVFRLVWGGVGGHWSRFAQFLYSPAALGRYLRGRSRPDERVEVGHSPLGALSVFGLLAVVAAQVATGLVADDEIATTGPLVRFVDGALSLQATSWHRTWGQWLLLGLVLAHVVAIIVYRVRQGRDLVTPMIQGDKRLPPGTPASADGVMTRLLALAIFVAAVFLALWVERLGG